MGLPNGVFKFLVTLLVAKSKEVIQLNVSYTIKLLQIKLLLK